MPETGAPEGKEEQAAWLRERGWTCEAKGFPWWRKNGGKGRTLRDAVNEEMGTPVEQVVVPQPEPPEPVPLLLDWNAKRNMCGQLRNFTEAVMKGQIGPVWYLKVEGPEVTRIEIEYKR